MGNIKESTIIKELIESHEKELVTLKLQERYAQRKVVLGSKDNQQVLGMVQGKIAAREDYLKFLNEVLKEK